MGNNIQAEKLEERGTKPSVNSKEKLVKLGKCPNANCGKIHVRFDTSITHATCNCQNEPVMVPMLVTITRQRYNDGKKLAKETGWSLQELLNDVYEFEMLE